MSAIAIEYEQWFSVLVGLAGNELASGEKTRDFRQELCDKSKEWALNVDLVNVTIGEELITKNSKRFSELGLFVNPFTKPISDKVIDIYLNNKDSKSGYENKYGQGGISDTVSVYNTNARWADSVTGLHSSHWCTKRIHCKYQDRFPL